MSKVLIVATISKYQRCGEALEVKLTAGYFATRSGVRSDARV